jgi:hypothetical protein
MSHNILVGDINTDVTLSSYGTGDLTLNTNSGTNSGSIVIADGANGNISLTPDGTGSVVIDGLSYPQADGNNGEVLTTDGSGNLSFTAVSGGGGGTIASQDANNVDIDGGAIDAVTLGTNSAITEAQIDLINIDGFAIDGQAASYGLVLKANGQFVARIQSTSQNAGGGLYLYQNNPYITFEGATGDAYETNLKVTDPTADRDITLPDATGHVPVFSTAPTSAITDGNNGQVLTTDGSGGLSFTTVSGGGGGSYANSDVDTHLNTGTASANEVLSWNGSDYDWVAQSGGGGGGGITTGKAIAMAMIFG